MACFGSRYRVVIPETHEPSFLSLIHISHLSWLEKISPEHDPERLSLAKMIAYLVTLSPELSDQRRTQLDCYMPRSRSTSRVLSLKSLSEDPASRLLVQKGDMQG